MNIMPEKDLNLSTINKKKKHKLLFSFDATVLNYQNKNGFITNENNQLSELDYKFEISSLKIKF